MTRRIFRNILLTAVLALLLSSALLVGTLYNVYEGRISAEMRTEAEYIVRAPRHASPPPNRYPTPRTVSIMWPQRPILVRSVCTCTSTVRVPPS